MILFAELFEAGTLRIQRIVILLFFGADAAIADYLLSDVRHPSSLLIFLSSVTITPGGSFCH